MSARPIIFSGEMIRRIISGEKSQTRRVMKPQPPTPMGTLPQSLTLVSDDAGENLCAVSRRAGCGGWFARCPYGQPGDQIWVRETWRIGAWNENTGAIAVDYQADGHSRREWLEIPEDKDPDGETFNRYWIQCSDDCEKAGGEPDADGQYHFAVGQAPTRWRSPIHMPRIASRITLEVTEVRGERLHDITRGDAMDEGCPFQNMRDGPDPRQWYTALWDSLHAKRGHGWDSNPFVWVIEFKKI